MLTLRSHLSHQIKPFLENDDAPPGKPCGLFSTLESQKNIENMRQSIGEPEVPPLVYELQTQQWVPHFYRCSRQCRRTGRCVPAESSMNFEGNPG